MAAEIASRTPPEVRSALEKRKKFQEQRGMEFRVQQPRQIEPRALERQFQILLRRRINTVLELIREELIPAIPTLLANDNVFKPRADALGDEMSVIINGIKAQFAEKVSETALRRIINNMGLAVSRSNLAQFRKVFKRSLGVDPFQAEPWLEGELTNLVEQNVNLIKTVDERLFTEIQENVFRGAREGKSVQDISRMVRERGKVAKSRADLIARDQINKFNGQLNQLRQQDVGLKRYRWRTALDERVRPEHANREGKVFSWDSPPSDGHPGQPINCRCYAEPVVEDLLDE